MTNHRKDPIWTKNFIGITITNFFIFLIFYALLTTLPIYVVDNLQRSGSDAGLVVTVFLLSAILIRPLSGKILDVFGKKKVLIICLIFFLLSTVLYIWLTEFYLLLALRFFHGLWFSIATTATGSIAADLVPISRKGEGLGYFVMSNNIAVVAGPFIALTLLQSSTFTVLFIVFTVLMIGGVLFSSSIQVSSVHHQASKSMKMSFDDLFERKAFPIASVGFLVAFSYSTVLSFISVYAQQKGLMAAASYFFVVFAVVMLLSRPFVGRLFDAKGPNIVVFPSLILFTAGLIALSLANSAFLLLFAGALLGLGYGTLVPCFQTMAIQSARTDRSAHATSTFFTFFDSGIAAGSFLLGIVATHFGYEKLYFSASIIALIALLFYRKVSSSAKQQVHIAPKPTQIKE
ncbi:MFS transporter [Pueribacillus theae]|uniref:MFS transporter n=1 Tax=Pueribacillus theae TaxID=2171751 RepID=A0A2U1JZV9_9BACI|nr:MFS transporter [Pueribacillus theae]PWA10672.1 MFS transporter [Pueribacillus theae]